ncbi:probable protein transport Sec1a isoform X6 [Chenopodium quinoa]|uniref:probable protein transport Sec1a isoform X6 n=1 Tax=Chenopodium quinoa TaxID=63459 RepID=UPI000B79A0B8|nr:probable protein transport Sec1a isoform X6 [Chenopodium quinoa]
MGLGSNPRIHTRIIREQKLREVGKLEQDLVFDDAGTKKVIKILSMHTDLSRENKLRLLMVYAAIYPEKFEGDKGSQLMQLAGLLSDDTNAVKQRKAL